MNAVIKVTAMPSGESLLCITCSRNRQLIRIRRAFIISILAMISIGSQSYLFASSAASLSRKLRSLSLRAILRQDSKSIWNAMMHCPHNFVVEYFDRDDHSVRTLVFT